MNWKPKYTKDKNKPYRDDWENLKVGDYVFTDSDVGFCSGGLNYGCGELVVKITKTEIITKQAYSVKKQRWNKNNKTHIQPPSAYYLGAFQSNNSGS
jgi:hypothetical protein